jgi:hypothetical protein
LLPDQEAKLKELYESAKTRNSALESQLTTQRPILESLLNEATGSIADAEKALNELLQIEAEIKRLQLRTILGMNQALDAAQRANVLALSRKDAESQPIVEAKIAKLREAVESLGFDPTEAIKRRGQSIEHLLANGEMDAANLALEAAMVDLGIADMQQPVPVIDFTEFAPGDIDLGALERRFQAVEAKVQTVESLATLRQFKQAHDALEAAKQAEDAISAGQILTWAESVLK